ncbi:MAG: 30S ribosomal protein S20 [Firmicutes bacterium]|nr:30S ribosomal protein S20 [Bacillota bacterium]
MPNIKSAKKRVVISELRRARNRSQRSELRTLIKKTENAIANEPEKARELITLSVKKLDKAVTKGLIHKNAAARKKSRLMRRFNSLSAS